MTQFPVGFRRFHANESFNFELNRWLAAWPEEEIRRMAAEIETAEDWKRAMLTAAAGAETEGRTKNAAFYWRAAEFFMHPSDPDKGPAYDRFVALFDQSMAGTPLHRARVPYAGSWLPAMVVPAAGKPKETILLHGGFDSFMEELVDWAMSLAAAGYQVVLFEGPGQGAALRKNGLVMRPDWERPVGAVLDHFAIERCTILGISLGGYLAPRAAAFEPRIRRVIAFDVLDDFFDCFAGRSGAAVAGVLRLLLRAGMRGAVNRMIARTIGANPNIAWALAHGMHVSGAADAFEFLSWLAALNTAPFSSRLTQDLLVLAGADDHIVPLRQFYRQARNLPNVRSFTGRVFSAREHAAQHCQIGNIGLAMKFVETWLDFQIEAENAGLLPAQA